MKFTSNNNKQICSFLLSLSLLLAFGTIRGQALTFSFSAYPQCFSPIGSNTVSAFMLTTPGSATNYTWTLNGPTGSCTPTFTYASPNGSLINIHYPCCGSYTVGCTAMNGTSTLTTTLNILTVFCQPVLTVSGNPSVCIGNSSTLAASGAQSYTWSNGTFASTTIIFPTVSNTYSVTGANANGCINTNTFFVNVMQAPQVSFSYTPLANGLVVFNNTSTNTTSATTYTWNFGNGITSNSVSPSITYTSNGIYTVSLTMNSTCGFNTISQTISVNSVGTPSCAASFTYLAGANGSYTFTSTSPNTSSSTNYSWYFGNGSPTFLGTGLAGVSPPVQNYVNGIYPVKLVITNYNPFCTDSVTVNISVCLVHADFSFAQAAGNTVNFTNNSTGTTSGTTYLWNFGDGSNGVGLNIAHTYSSTGAYTVNLIASAGSSCTSSTTKTIVVNGCSLVSNFTHTALTNGLVNFSSNSSTASTASRYYWDFGDGVYSLANSPSHTYVNAGTYYVKLKIQDTISTCQDSLIQSINITGISCMANANFSVTPSFTPQYWSAVPAYPYNVTSAQWHWGDGAQSNSLYASHVYTVAANYSICLSVTVSCGASSTYCHSYNLNKSISNSSEIIYINVEPPAISTGIENSEEVALAMFIYPNPNRGEFNIQLDGTNKEVTLSVYNLIGELVYSEKMREHGTTEKIHLKTVASGIYFVKLNSDSKTITRKIVISQ